MMLLGSDMVSQQLGLNLSVHILLLLHTCTSVHENQEKKIIIILYEEVRI